MNQQKQKIGAHAKMANAHIKKGRQIKDVYRWKIAWPVIQIRRNRKRDDDKMVRGCCRAACATAASQLKGLDHQIQSEKKRANKAKFNNNLVKIRPFSLF